MNNLERSDRGVDAWLGETVDQLDLDELIGAVQAAQELDVHRRRIVALIHSKRLPAKKIGRSYVIKRRDLELVRKRHPGRPRKTTDPQQ